MSRLLPEHKPKPTITLDATTFPFITKLSYGDIGGVSISGTITRERVDEEEENILKTIQIKDMTPISEKRAE